MVRILGRRGVATTGHGYKRAECISEVGKERRGKDSANATKILLRTELRAAHFLFSAKARPRAKKTRATANAL